MLNIIAHTPSFRGGGLGCGWVVACPYVCQHVKDAREFKPPCMQSLHRSAASGAGAALDRASMPHPSYGGVRAGEASLAPAEDCLYLNVWTPGVANLATGTAAGATLLVPTDRLVHGLNFFCKNFPYFLIVIFVLCFRFVFLNSTPSAPAPSPLRCWCKFCSTTKNNSPRRMRAGEDTKTVVRLFDSRFFSERASVRWLSDQQRNLRSEVSPFLSSRIG